MCGKKSEAKICPECGFDPSRDYEQYPTLTAVKKAPAVSALRKNWQKGERAEEPKKKRPWLSLIASILILALGIGIGAGFGSGKPKPTEPQGTVQMQEPTDTTDQTAQITYLPEEEPWRKNILQSDEPIFAQISYVFGSKYKRDLVRTVTFLDTLADAPEDAWDVSEARDGRVLAWVTKNETFYNLYIGAEGGVSAGKSCQGLFERYRNAEYFYFNNAFHTENAESMRSMFTGCDALEELDLSSFDTSNVQDMSYMFYSCRHLRSLDVTGFDTSNVRDMSGMFLECFCLADIDLSNFDTAQVQDMSDMFANCGDLTSLDLSNFDTSNVEKMYSMFYCCAGLTSLDLSNFNTANVWNMTKMFSCCHKLTSLDLDSFDTSNVSYMEGMFENCYDLASLDLSSFDTSGVQSMEGMFYKCLNLINLNLGDSFVTQDTDTTDMFYECPAAYTWRHLLK